MLLVMAGESFDELWYSTSYVMSFAKRDVNVNVVVVAQSLFNVQFERDEALPPGVDRVTE